MRDNSFKKAREIHMKERERALYDDILAQLEEAIKLKKSGHEKDADAIVGRIKAKLERMISEEESKTECCPEREFDRAVLPSAEMIFAVGEKLLLRVVTESEKEDYLSVSYEYSNMKGMFNYESFREGLWNAFMEEAAFVCTILDKETMKYVGYCSIKDLRKMDWEISIELKPQWCNQGYGTEALSLFLQNVYRITGNRFFRARVDIDNYASQALMEKLGAYPNGISEFLLSGEDLEKFKRENIHMIDENMIKVAEKFCMDPEEILGHVLEYRFDMSGW